MQAESDTESDRNPPDTDSPASFGQTTPAQEEVKKFLAQLGLAEFWDDFLHEGADDMAVLQQLSDTHLEQLRLGVGHIIKFRSAISKLQTANASASEGETLSKDSAQGFASQRAALEQEKSKLEEERRTFQLEKQAFEQEKMLARQEMAELPEVDPDVRMLLLEADLEQHSQLFARHGLVRLEDVLALKEHHMEKMGLVIGHVLRLERSISEKLREREEAAVARADEEPASEQEAMRRIYERLPPARRERNDETLLTAAKNGDQRQVEYLLLKAGANPNASTINDNLGFTPLHWASLYGHLEVAKFLVVKAGANVNIRNLRGWTPLHAAVEFGRLEVVKWLVTEVSANPNIPDKKGHSALHCAVGKPAIEAILRQAGAL